MTFILRLWRFYYGLQLFSYQPELNRYMYFLLDVTIWRWSAHFKVYKGREVEGRECSVRVDCQIPLPKGYFSIMPFQRVVPTCTIGNLYGYKIEYYSVFHLRIGKYQFGGIKDKPKDAHI